MAEKKMPKTPPHLLGWRPSTKIEQAQRFVESLPLTPLAQHLGSLHAMFDPVNDEHLTAFEYHLREIARVTAIDPAQFPQFHQPQHPRG